MKLIAATLAAAMLTGCASKTEFGDCVGLGDKQKPDLTYKVSVRNLVVGIIFFELIAPPIYVAVDQLYCPVGKATP